MFRSTLCVLNYLREKVWNCCMHNKCMGSFRNLTEAVHRRVKKNYFLFLHTVLRILYLLTSTVYHKLLLRSSGHIHLCKGLCINRMAYNRNRKLKHFEISYSSGCMIKIHFVFTGLCRFKNVTIYSQFNSLQERDLHQGELTIRWLVYFVYSQL